MLKRYQYLILIVVSVVAVRLSAQDYGYIENIGYYGELINDAYQKEPRKIDLY